VDLEEKNGRFLPELERRINLEHLAYSIKAVINGKCYTVHRSFNSNRRGWFFKSFMRGVHLLADLTNHHFIF